MSIKVTGLHKLENDINDIPNKTMKGIKKVMGIIYNESQLLVPVDTGRLKRSAEVREIKDGYELIYHAENPSNGYNYAPIQHENMYFKHKVGQAKYLEDAVKNNMDEIKQIIAEEVVK